MMDSIEIFNERLAIVRQQLHELYESDDIALWLVTPHPRLHGRQPADLLWSENGYRQVSTMIQQLLDSAFI